MQQGSSKIDCLFNNFPKLFLRKALFSEYRIFFLVGYFFVKWKTLSLCFELNISHNELKDNVFGQVYIDLFIDLFMRVLWNSCNKTLENIQKNIRSWVPFYKNYTTDTFLEVITKEKMFKKNALHNCLFKGLHSRNSYFNKNKRSEMTWKLAWKKSIMNLFY